MVDIPFEGNEEFDLERFNLLSPLEKEKVLEALGIIKDSKELNPLYYYNHPVLSERPVHWKQLIFHGMPFRERYFFGGNQSGKTTAGLVDDIIQAIDGDAVPDHLKFIKRYEPPCYIRVLTTDMITMELTVYQKIKELVPVDQLVSGKWERAFNSQQRVLRFKNGSMIQFMTYKQEVKTMGGATLHRVHFDEEPPFDVWSENNLRIMRRGGDLITTMTPLEGLTWTYSDVWEKVAENPDYETKENCVWEAPQENTGIVLVDMDDNPFLSEEDKYETLKNFPPEVVDARKRGKFVHFAGLIYGEFRESEHVIPTAEIVQLDENDNEIINPNVNVVVGIDPGIRNRCAVIYAALDYEDNLFIFDEIYEQGKTISEICDQIKLINAKWQIEPIYYVIDEAARNRNNQTGRSDQMEFADNGIFTIMAQRAVEAGINRVKERLRNQRIFIFDDCRYLIKEFKKYRWRESPRTGEDGKPVPVKTEDHAMDALRYIVMSRPYLPEEQRKNDETYLQRVMREDQERFDNSKAPVTQYGGVFS